MQAPVILPVVGLLVTLLTSRRPKQSPKTFRLRFLSGMPDELYTEILELLEANGKVGTMSLAQGLVVDWKPRKAGAEEQIVSKWGGPGSAPGILEPGGLLVSLNEV